MLELSKQFNNAIADAMQKASALDHTIRMDIIGNMIARYTAVGAAKKLSNNDEQSGFRKLVMINKAELTFEYFTAKAHFSKLFDKCTIENARKKLRPYIGNQVDNL